MRWWFAVALVGCASGAITPPGVPDAPANVTDRVGVYTWGFDDSSWPGTPDRLTWSAGEIAQLGTHVARVAISPDDPYQVTGGATSLADIAATPAYATLWGDPRWTTVLVTAYAEHESLWADGLSDDEATVERADFQALATYLGTFPSKTFVILPWEGDNALSAFAGNDTAWDGYVAWIQARADGIAAARTNNVHSGLEFNLVRDPADDVTPCDDAAHRCVISYVAPRVAVDYYSYSSWQSLAATVDDHDVQTQLTADLGAALAYVQPAHPEAAAKNLIVGEFGSARDLPQTNECSAALRSVGAIDAAIGFGASYAVYWQIIDNPPASGDFTGFGAFKYDNTRSAAGTALSQLWSGTTPTLAGTCPSISTGGVVNGVTFDQMIHPGDTLSIFGSGFAPSGNVVHVKQGATTAIVVAGSTYWYESPGQINFTLPLAIVSGATIRVYVTGTLDSNGDLVGVL